MAIDTVSFVRSVSRALCHAASLAKDIVWIPVAALCMMGWKADGHPEKDTVKGRPAIVLLHGSGSSPGTMFAVRKKIERDFYGSVFVPYYDAPWGGTKSASIAQLTDGLAPEMERIYALIGQRSVVFVGHSMGGLIAADYADRWAERHGADVLGIVSVCTPWHGTTRLVSGWGKVVSDMMGPPERHRDMHPQSDFVKRIHDSERRPPIRTIGTTTDVLVPIECARAPDDRVCHMVVHGTGHYAIIVDGSAVDFVRGSVSEWVG